MDTTVIHEEQRLQRSARFLSVFTVAYNMVEGVVSVIVAALSGSPALLGFGFDSFVESLSGGVMIWRFKKRTGMSTEDLEKLEARAIQLVGWSFLILGAYVVFESASKLYHAERPEQTLLGIGIALASLVIMPALYFLKIRVAKALKSRSLRADSKQTLGCILLSVALLVGLAANYFFGYWWMDPLAGIFIAVFLIKEGIEAINEKELCCG